MNKYLLTIPAFAWVMSAYAQQGSTLTTKDYEHAESFMTYNTAPFVDRADVRPNWLPGDKFWYRVLTAQGSEFVLVDPVKKTREAAFDHQKLAQLLSAASGNKYDGNMLPFQTISFPADGKKIMFTAADKHWQYDLTTDLVTAGAEPERGRMQPGGRRGKTEEVLSPDGNRAAYIKDYNLWVRDTKTGSQSQLTTDGIKDFGYATDNAGWQNSDAAILRWSPDSKKIATFKQDQRKVSDMYLVTTNVGKPVLKQWKYPLPGDEIAMITRVIIEVDHPKVITLQVPPDAHRATLSDDISSSGTFDDVDWSSDASKLAFVSTSRDHKNEKFRIADAATGAVKEVFEETVKTQYESGWGAINWKFLPKTNEIIWFSERDNWGHLYLYDAATGKVKNQITKGDFVVTRLLKVDEKTRTVYFIAGGLEKENPYYSQLCKAGFDGKHFTVLTPEEGNHNITLSPGGGYFVDSYSKPDVPPVTVLRGMDGKLITNLEKADVSRLTATGWKAPTPVKLIAGDGKTDIYGLIFTPTNMDASKKYPVIDYIYPGRERRQLVVCGFKG